MINTTIPHNNQGDRQSADFFTICYSKIAQFLQKNDKALLVQRLHYWLQNPKCGYFLRNGTKWIYNSYVEWAAQLNCSPQQVGRFVRELESRNWIITERFSNLMKIGFISKIPESLHGCDRRKWYQLNYEQIFLDTGFDLQGVKYNTPTTHRVETLAASQCSKKDQGSFISENSSIYKEFPENYKEVKSEVTQEEKEDVVEEQLPITAQNEVEPIDSEKKGVESVEVNVHVEKVPQKPKDPPKLKPNPPRQQHKIPANYQINESIAAYEIPKYLQEEKPPSEEELSEIENHVAEGKIRRVFNSLTTGKLLVELPNYLIEPWDRYLEIIHNPITRPITDLVKGLKGKGFRRRENKCTSC